MKKLLETFGEHGKDGKHQPDDLKRFIYDSKCSICDSKHFFGNQMPLKLNTFHVPMYPAVCVGHIWKRGPTSVIDTFCQ